jgi:hypothetical protein
MAATLFSLFYWPDNLIIISWQVYDSIGIVCGKSAHRWYLHPESRGPIKMARRKRSRISSVLNRVAPRPSFNADLLNGNRWNQKKRNRFNINKTARVEKFIDKRCAKITKRPNGRADRTMEGQGNVLQQNPSKSKGRRMKIELAQKWGKSLRLSRRFVNWVSRVSTLDSDLSLATFSLC